MSRPSKLTPECQQAICEAIRNGASLEEASDGAGISRKTLHRWMRRGERLRTGLHRAFYVAVGAALRDARARLLSVVQRASRYDARAAMFLLKTNFRMGATDPRTSDPIDRLISMFDADSVFAKQEKESDVRAAQPSNRRRGGRRGT